MPIDHKNNLYSEFIKDTKVASSRLYCLGDSRLLQISFGKGSTTVSLIREFYEDFFAVVGKKLYTIQSNFIDDVPLSNPRLSTAVDETILSYESIVNREAPKSKIKVNGLTLGVEDFVASPSGTFGIAAIYYGEHILRGDYPDEYEFSQIHQLHRVDLITGKATYLVDACSVGEIHPDGSKVLFSDKEGGVSILTLATRKVQRLPIRGSRPMWNSDGAGVRYVKAFHYTRQEGNASSPATEGDKENEYEYDLSTGKEKMIGKAGEFFIWSPDRRYGLRFFEKKMDIKYLFVKYKFTTVFLEAEDRSEEVALIDSMPCPRQAMWAISGE